jgi:hypothetical protein
VNLEEVSSIYKSKIDQQYLLSDQNREHPEQEDKLQQVQITKYFFVECEDDEVLKVYYDNFSNLSDELNQWIIYVSLTYFLISLISEMI